MRRFEEEIAALQDAHPRRLIAPGPHRMRSSGAFNSAAERIEGITKKLNQTVGNGSSVAIG